MMMTSSWKVGGLLAVVTVAFFSTLSDSIFQQCTIDRPYFNPELEVTRYGKPTAFVYTKSVGLSPYSLIDPYRQSALYHEYILIGPGIASDNIELKNEEEEIQLILYDEELIHAWETDVNLVQQNLGKQYLWSLINATGMLPSMTVVNTTFEQTFRFHTDEGDEVSYHLPYPLFRSQETLPPIDVLIEFPAKTRMFQSLKTLIDYQTFGLLRWRLTPSDTVDWMRIADMGWELTSTIENASFCNLPPKNVQTLDDPQFLRCIYSKRFLQLSVPCIKDMIIVYTLRGVSGVPGNDSTYLATDRLLMTIPMIYDILNYGWIDLTDAYCPSPDKGEECAEPLALVLTNDHLLIHTDKALWVSSSLNASSANSSFPYSMKPLMKWTPVDPCGQYEFFNCSEVNTPTLARQTVRRQRLFYTPVCHLYQYPIYEDMVMLVIDHVSQSPDLSQERDVFTVLYAATPYLEWKFLFHAMHEYIAEDGPLAIAELLGIFFNHHRRHFDVTLLLTDPAAKGTQRTIRFVLPLPTTANFKGYQYLDGLLGNGFVEHEFPPEFHMLQLTVNPEPLDVFFMGNQVWIAEAGGPFVYSSIPVITTQFFGPSTLDSCSFNHPDRTFACIEKTHEVIYVGRVGVTYTASSVLFADVTELKFTVLYNTWPFAYRQYVAMLGNFVVGYSGKIMLWYFYDPEDLIDAQKELAAKIIYNPNVLCHNPAGKGDQSLKCNVCKRLAYKMIKQGCQIADKVDKELRYRFRMIAMDAARLKTREFVTDGPLVPFLLDGDKVVLYEAAINDLPDHQPAREYLTEVDIGRRLFCTEKHLSLPLQPPQGAAPPGLPGPVNPTGPKWATKCPSARNLVDRKFTCELYIKHMKRLERKGGDQVFLKGFRRALFATIIDSFYMRPVPTDLVVVVHPNTNEVVIQLDTFMFRSTDLAYNFEFSDVGQTLYIPGHFSVFMTGFVGFKRCPFPQPGAPPDPLLMDMTRMAGLATRYFRQGVRLNLNPFEAFIIDFSSPEYCTWYSQTLEQLNATVCTDDPQPSDVISQEYRTRRQQMDDSRTLQYERRGKVTESAISYFKQSIRQTLKSDLMEKLDPLDPQTYQEVEDELLQATKLAIGPGTFPFEWVHPVNDSPEVYRSNPDICKVPSWQLFDGGCHLRLSLSDNPVIMQNGGRISLDKYDSISFQVRLRPLTPIGKSLIHRPLIALTNTNPTLLSIEKSETSGKDAQSVNITLSPTGFGIGVATLSIRPLIVSSECLFADGSFSLIVQIQREQGRRLHVNYPVPTCKPSLEYGGYERPWKVDIPTCVPRHDLLFGREVIRPESDIGQVFYSELPVNYRPPSLRGVKIPLSEVLYNTAPEQPYFNAIYRISQETGELNKCQGKKTREECDCSDNDRLSDDVAFTDCKRMVYTAQRGFRVDISVEYDRIMRDRDQHEDFFTPKNNWTVFVEEINNRKEFTLSSQNSPYLELINEKTDLHQGRQHFDSKTLGVTLHGTGLFHFKVTLGHFESFDEVSGYFIIFIPNNRFNHVQLIIIMLLTITICMAFVFCGFLVVRRRLSSQLPFQTQTNEKIKLE